MDFLGVAPFVVVTAAATWVGQGILFSAKQKQLKAEQGDRLQIHRDELTFEILSAARAEMAAARIEVEDLRAETDKLRGLEAHFYHFQQALDHLEAVLHPKNMEDYESAKRAARAFLNRMRRMNEAKGTIRDATQVVESTVAMAERDLREFPNADS